MVYKLINNYLMELSLYINCFVSASLIELKSLLVEAALFQYKLSTKIHV